MIATVHIVFAHLHESAGSFVKCTPKRIIHGFGCSFEDGIARDRAEQTSLARSVSTEFGRG
jgi:hypothetical protein